ncbi:hypothetical protein JKF63_07603 [Porcisia hertigi]|uniref:Uncharacterized protein n=1 Tax=Porcisia hertigi TaxID=2761500 RepID=A0A836LM93_9TRYP|nr:hypothetical protein JKF63_07603 [Porcisia hertigi]
MSYRCNGEDNRAAGVYPSVVDHITPGRANDHRSLAALRIVRDVLLMEDWFVERPPLALAFAHPYTRLWCEMWRTEYMGDFYTPAAHEPSVAESSHPTQRRGNAVPAPPPASFLRIGSHRLRNPVSVPDPAHPGAADILSGGAPLNSSSSLVSSHSPYATAAQRRMRSLVAPVLTYPVQAAAAEPLSFYDAAVVRGIPVVDPTAPLYTLETYTEHIFRMPIGMKLGHVRLLTLWLPYDGPCHPAQGNRPVRLVRGLFSHVPAAVRHSAANKAAACIDAMEKERAGRQGSQQMPAPAVSTLGVSASSGGVAALDIDSCVTATIDDGNDASAEQKSAFMTEEAIADDWEAVALEEEALLEQQPASVLTAALAPATAAPHEGGHPSTLAIPQAQSHLPTFTTHSGPSLLAGATESTTTTTTTVLTDTSTVVAAPVARGDASAVIEGVCVALPPPCGWWLRRGVQSASAPHGPPLPLYAHAIEATRQWLEWLEAVAACGTRGCDALPDESDGDVAQSFLCGVSLSGWSSKYVQPTIVSRAEFARRSVPVKLEDAISSTLPLRGLHVESSVVALKRLLDGGNGSRGGPRGRAAFLSTLVAIDTPYLQDVESDGCVDRDRLAVRDGGGTPGLASAFTQLSGLRFLCVNHSRNVLTEAASASSAQTHVLGSRVEELLLYGITSLTAPTLALVGRCCVSLRTVDLTSTDIGDDELRAFVFGTWESPDKVGEEGGSEPAACPERSSPLACLEEVRLVACRRLSRVDALAALPRLRCLNLQSSGVRHVSDLAGCRLLEEVVLTRCERVTELHPLWRLPRLRSVEADGVRQLQQHRALMPPSASSAERGDDDADDDADACFVAPLVRLNLAQAAAIRGASVGHLARRLGEFNERFSTLAVLLLDHTDVDGDTLRALAGLPTVEEETGGFTERCRSVASSLRELSLVGCARVHHLGPLGALPQLTRLVADQSGVERVDGLQHSRTLDYLSMSHCTRLSAISPLAYATSLRCLDVSHTLLNDDALLRFVYPNVVDEQAEQGHSHLEDVATFTGSRHQLVRPGFVASQIEELRLCQCVWLRHIGCVAHLPQLRRLDVGHTAVFDRDFVSLFFRAEVLLRTLSGFTVHPSRDEVDDGTEPRLVHPPDEAALLAAWREDLEGGVAVPPRDVGNTSAEILVHRDADITPLMPLRTVEFDLCVGAVDTLTHVSLFRCVAVRCIAPLALFHRLSSLDVTGTAVDSASLLVFVNVLLEGCSSGGVVDLPVMRLEVEGGDLRPRPISVPRRRFASAASPSVGGRVADGLTLVPPRRRQRPFTLTRLTLGWCHYLTDVRCCAAVPSLHHLDVSGSPVDNVSIAAFSPRGTPALSATPAEETLWWWQHHRCSLLSLNVAHCRRVTDIAPLFSAPPNSLSGGSSSSDGGGWRGGGGEGGREGKGWWRRSSRCTPVPSPCGR